MRVLLLAVVLAAFPTAAQPSYPDTPEGPGSPPSYPPLPTDPGAPPGFPSPPGGPGGPPPFPSAPGGRGEPPPLPATPVPLDGSLGLLALAGAAYAARKLRAR